MNSMEFRDALYALHEEYNLKGGMLYQSPDFWYVADRLPLDKLLSELKYLTNTNLMSSHANDWHQLCAIINDYKKYNWTKKQRYWCICQLAIYWDAICERRCM